jgi:hypothetical protein
MARFRRFGLSINKRQTFTKNFYDEELKRIDGLPNREKENNRKDLMFQIGGKNKKLYQELG